MKLTEWMYERPDMETLAEQFRDAMVEFNEANSEISQWSVLQSIYQIFDEFETMYNISFIRHTQDTSDEVWLTEKRFFDEALPTFQGWQAKLMRAMLDSQFRGKLEERIGCQAFLLAASSVKTYSSAVEDELRKENEQSTNHLVWISQAKIDFDGEAKTLSEMLVYQQSQDRGVRKNALNAVYSWMQERAEQFDTLYHDLVSVRTSIARQLGFEDFVGLGYARMNRIDYNREDVARFREAVKRHIVPLLTELAERQRQRIGVNTLTYYDAPFRFSSGNPRPRGDMEWVEATAAGMYDELSPETGAFFRFMRENELMDLKKRPNKAMMGYCTYVPGYASPFIFSLDNGTSFDVIVVTHEAGHAFQKYMNQHTDVPEYRNPTKETAEIYSKSMELFTWPWMEKFFGKDTEKFKFDHMVSSLGEIAYVAMYDEFQEMSYSHPEWTREQRRQAFRRLQATYEPYIDTEGHPYLEGGYSFHMFQHIYRVPFYTIDYALAQVSAFQFWSEAERNRSEAWEKYITLTKLSGSRPFQQLLQTAGLRSPFEDRCVAEVIAAVKSYLDNVNDKIL